MKKPTSQARLHQKNKTVKAQKKICKIKQRRRDEVLASRVTRVVLTETDEQE
jgi:hypothetical protein